MHIYRITIQFIIVLFLFLRVARLNVNLEGKKTNLSMNAIFSKTCLKRPLKNRQNKDLNELNEGLSFITSRPIYIWHWGYKTFFMLNSAEHEMFPVHKC